jgi:glycosyltransferase involved in cell wall biosynthesis
VRVLQVMECTIGGTRRHLRDLTLGLLERGISVEVACAALRDPAMRRDMELMRERGAVVHDIPMVRPIRPRTDALHALRLAGILCDRGFDVIHTHSSKAGALGRSMGALLSGAVRIHTPHTYAASFDGGKGQGGEAPGPLKIILTTERLLGHVTHRLVHVSSDEREEGQALGVIPAKRARVVPNGIDPARFASPTGGAELRRELGIPADAPVIGTVGLLNDAKGHDLLIEAASALPAAVQLLLVGHGELEGDLRALAGRLGIAERVHFTGWRDEVHSAHAAMDVFALPSRWEGLSYAMLEALAAGLPVVSTAVNGSREVLTPDDAPACGLVVPCEDVAALTEGLRRVLEDETLAAGYRDAGPARVSERYTLDAMVDGTLAVYRDALGRDLVRDLGWDPRRERETERPA